MKLFNYYFLIPVIWILESSEAAASATTKSFVDEKESGRTWAVLIAGSNDWQNYRHQADVCHAYQILIENGILPENIIVLMYDDIANNELNRFPGSIFNEPNGKNVYSGIKIDYSGTDVTAETFFNVLTGNKSGNSGKGSGKVLETNATDNLFVYYAGHGNIGILGTPKSYFHKNDLFNTFEIMNSNKMFKNLVFYVEACFAGSMFTNLNPDWNIYAITASSNAEESYATYCSAGNGLPCLADLFSIFWMKDTVSHDIFVETIGTQFDDVKTSISSLRINSKISEYGKRSIRLDTVAVYQGSKDNNKCPETTTTTTLDPSLIDSREVALLMAEQIAHQKGYNKSQIFGMMQNYTKLRSDISKFVTGIVKSLVPDSEVGKALTSIPSNLSQLKCHQIAMKAFDECIPLASNLYAFKFSLIFANLCEILKDEILIVKELKEKCKNGPLFMGAI